MSDLRTFTPREIVSELDRYIVGQREAKRAVAIALRNRWRRQQVRLCQRYFRVWTDGKWLLLSI